MKKLSERLSFILERRGVTRYELANEAGVCESTLCRIMNGEQEKIHKKTAVNIANYLRISEKWLRLGVGAFDDSAAAVEQTENNLLIPVEELWSAYQKKEKQLESVIRMLEDQIRINEALRAELMSRKEN